MTLGFDSESFFFFLLHATRKVAKATACGTRYSMQTLEQGALSTRNRKKKQGYDAKLRS